MAKTLSQKSSYRLFLWGMVLIPFAIVSDAVLDSVLFGDETIMEQLFSPTYHEVAIRLLFSTFILAGIYLGIHYLANTAQKELSLHRQNQDLGFAKQDTEEFHENLSRQLRHTSAALATNIELMETQCGQDFDERMRFFMQSIHNSSDKLNEQLDINQALSELACGEPRREKCKFDKLAQEVVEELQSINPDRQIEFHIQPWIIDWCDLKMMRLVIYNLFSNSMNFIPHSRQGRIDFGMFNRNTKKVFFVRDNGTGYNNAQAKRLFDVFRDSSLDADLPKDSINLANAKRIINRHGGQIWAEGTEDAGGTIFFTCNTPQ